MCVEWLNINLCHTIIYSRTLPDFVRTLPDYVLVLSVGPWPGSNIGFYCIDKNLGSRMKTFLSVIDSYDEIMDFIFLPNLSPL
jgi:hypothetical protein